ncbi:MAG: hypothetical protein DMG97_42905 [Acidobacteria bacterium]|nr:MAG: hypothetical protein DMG97_42905 [Acidobacteriota bacterium]
MRRSIIFSLWVSTTILMVGFTTGKAMSQAGDVVVHAATVDLTHFTGTEPVDQIDMTTTFTKIAALRGCRLNHPSWGEGWRSAGSVRECDTHH